MTVIPIVGWAFLDALAVGESEPKGTPRGSGYNKLCGGGTFSGFSKFPQWAGVVIDGVRSHAAGRYQFQPGTWDEEAKRLGLRDFSPSSQDAAAWDLAGRTYHEHIGCDLETDLLAGRLAEVVPALHSTWPSLSSETFLPRFRAALATLQPTAAPALAPALAPSPSAPVAPISPGIGIGIGGPYTAELATVLSLAGLIMSAAGLWMHARQFSPSKGQ
jgi:muramidase (phage lysozyme)